MRVRRSRRFSLEGLPVRRVECSLGVCAAALTGSFPPAVAKEARDPAALLTGVDEQTKATANNMGRSFGAGYVIAHVPFTSIRSPGQHRIVIVEKE